MTTFTAPVKLGERYRDDRTGMEGHADVVCFNKNGCIEVELEYTEVEGTKTEVKKILFSSLRLKPSGHAGGDQDYDSDIVLGAKYRDTQTGLEGWACSIEFHETMATRVVIRNMGEDKTGNTKLNYHSIDDFLLERIDVPAGTSPTPVERKDAKPSPITRQVERRR